MLYDGHHVRSNYYIASKVVANSARGQMNRENGLRISMELLLAQDK